MPDTSRETEADPNSVAPPIPPRQTIEFDARSFKAKLTRFTDIVSVGRFETHEALLVQTVVRDALLLVEEYERLRHIDSINEAAVNAHINQSRIIARCADALAATVIANAKRGGGDRPNSLLDLLEKFGVKQIDFLKPKPDDETPATPPPQ